MFQFTGCPPCKGWHDYSCQVSPFGDLRVSGYLHLTAAFRSLSRPSSADMAKASAVRPYLLDLRLIYGSYFRNPITLLSLEFLFLRFVKLPPTYVGISDSHTFMRRLAAPLKVVLYLSFKKRGN